MSRRFSDEPINLIKRIPTPEQMLAARPSKKTWGQTVMEAGSACMQSIAAVINQITSSQKRAEAPGSERADPHASVGDLSERIASRDARQQPISAVLEGAGLPGQLVQPEEVAELRAYILSQQHDIARLSAQLQELKSMVVSQQQVLLYMGKDLEGTPSSMTGVASAPAKRHRAIREKPFVKDKATSRKDAQNPSLSL